MNTLRRLWCLLRGHSPQWYERNGIFHMRCKSCKMELKPNHKGSPFGW